MQFDVGQELIIQLPSSGRQIIGTWDGSQLRVGSSLAVGPGKSANSPQATPAKIIVPSSMNLNFSIFRTDQIVEGLLHKV